MRELLGYAISIEQISQSQGIHVVKCTNLNQEKKPRQKP